MEVFRMAEYQNGGSNATPISGRYVAHARASLIERAFHAADLVVGATTLQRPTVVQAAELWRVNRTYVAWAIKRWDNRGGIEAGLMALVPPRVLALPAPRVAIDDVQIIDFVRNVGISRVLDAAVAVEAAE
jgi:hypothetical protein